MCKERNLTNIAKKLHSSLHGEIQQLKLFDMVSFNEANVDIIGYDKRKNEEK